MRKNGFLVLGLMLLHSAVVSGDDRFGRNVLFAAAQNNDMKTLAKYAKTFHAEVMQLDDEGIQIPKYDGAGIHLLHVFALHAKNLDFFITGVEMFVACGLNVDELEQCSNFHNEEVEQCGRAPALHYVYRRTNCSQKVRLQLITQLLDCGASPFIESIDCNGALQNAYELTLSKNVLGGISDCRPWLLGNKKHISTLFSRNARYVVWHRLLSTYALTDLSQEKIQNIIRYIFDIDDACALVAFLFWLRRPIVFVADLPAAPRCAGLRDDAALLQQAKDLYCEAVVLPEAVCNLRRSVPGVQSNNIVTLLRARESGAGRLRR